MASPVEVQEDFFGKLVDDDDDNDDPRDLSGSGPGSAKPDRAKGPLNSCTGEEDSALVDYESSGSNGVEDNNVNEQTEASMDGNNGRNDLQSGSGVKVVDWSAFTADNNNTKHGAGKGSFSDFFNEIGDGNPAYLCGHTAVNSVTVANSTSRVCENAVSSVQYHESQDMNSIQYWENQYPGWKYDSNTGQWYQVVEGYNSQQCFDANYTYSQQCFSNWNQDSRGNLEYPSHMVFDSQYPGWYYDTIGQEWRLLESYNASSSMTQQHSQHFQNEVSSTYEYSNGNNHQNIRHESNNFADNQQYNQLYDSTNQGHNSNDQQNQQFFYKSSGENSSFDMSNGVSGSQNYNQAESFSQLLNQHNQREQNQNLHCFDSPKNSAFSQKNYATQFSSASDEVRSSAGRPPHALVTFGFGGRLLVMKNNSSFLTNSAFVSQDSVGGMIHIMNLVELVMEKSNASSRELGAFGYFHTLCHQSFPGPLVGVNVGSRDLNKWIDEKIRNCEIRSNMDYRNGELLRLLYSLLKIACQCYGKLRSPFGADQSLKDSDSPESAVANLFASAKKTVSEYTTTLQHCLQNFPSEAQIQVTAVQVQKLLVSGRIKEALHCAQEGQLWGPALVLATQLGDQYYADTVKKMAVCQLVDGSPLRTLCLLIAGQPADVFSSTTNIGSPTGVRKIYQQHSQLGAQCMLHDWEENLAIITANRTKDDELVIIHLGDCLWKDKGEVLAAHICYLVAEANFASYSDTARLCLIGADHWRYPRTYASPEAIQSTELYEHSKVLGNPQFLLLPFQPYKFIYALMLAEVGKLSDALKYCQAILKCLKTGRASEVDIWKRKVASLEERLRIHQQGGYSTTLAPGKLVGKLLNLFDSTAHLVVGGLPPQPPSPLVMKQNNIIQQEHEVQKPSPRVSNSHSTMAMSSLVPSSSVEPVSELTTGNNRIKVSNRCASEPDFIRIPKKADDPPKESSTALQEKPSPSGGSSRFGRFGSSLFQKTVGFVWRSRSDRQAKLGEQNKFYYDEKLKRWVEEGAETTVEETPLPPPPTSISLHKKMPSINLKDGESLLGSNDGSENNNKSPSSSECSPSSGIPPIPPSSNQLASRRRMGIRSRYVDTFNKGSAPQTNLFLSPTAKQGSSPNTKFFVPSPPSSIDDSMPTSGETTPASIFTSSELPSPISENTPFSSSATARPEPILQRIPSMDHISNRRMRSIAQSSASPHSRRTLSWGGGSINPSGLSRVAETKELGFSPSVFVPGGNDSGTRSDMHEVEL